MINVKEMCGESKALLRIAYGIDAVCVFTYKMRKQAIYKAKVAYNFRERHAYDEDISDVIISRNGNTVTIYRRTNMKKIPDLARKHNKYYQQMGFGHIIREAEERKKAAEIETQKKKNNQSWKYNMWVQFFLEKGVTLELAQSMARSKIEEGRKK